MYCCDGTISRFSLSQNCDAIILWGDTCSFEFHVALGISLYCPYSLIFLFLKLNYHFMGKILEIRKNLQIKTLKLLGILRL